MKSKQFTGLLICGMLAGMAFDAAQGAVTTVWNPAANPVPIIPPAVGDWGDGANWTAGAPTPDPDPSPNKAVFNVAGAAEAQVTDARSVIQLVQGDGGGATGSGGVIRVTDTGSLTVTTSWTGIGYNKNAHFIVESGGTVTLGSHLWAGPLTGGNAIIDIRGVLTVNGNFGLGTINAKDAGGGVATLSVFSGGIVNLNQWSAWNATAGTGSIHDGSLINLFGGTVTIKGNRVSQVDAYVALGRIVGGGPIERSYDSGTNLTTITSVPEPGSWALLGLAGLGLLARHRRRPTG